MNYASRLVAKSRGPSSRLSARQVPMYAPMETLFERYEEVLLPAAVPGPDAPPARPSASAVAATRRPAKIADTQDRQLQPRRAPEPVAPPPLVPTKMEPRKDLPERSRTARTKQQSVERNRIVYLRDDRVTDAGENVIDAPLVPVTSQTTPASRSFVRAAPLDVALVPQRAARTLAEDESGSTVVNVVIGRIDVRAGEPETKPKREEPFRPRLSLDAYLSGRGGER